MTKTFDPTKPVQTRDGRPARIICTDRKGEFPIVALLDYDEVDARAFAANGTVWGDGPDHKNDLINIPTKVTKYGVVCAFGLRLPLFDTEDDARHACPLGDTIATVTWED